MFGIVRILVFAKDQESAQDAAREDQIVDEQIQEAVSQELVQALHSPYLCYNLESDGCVTTSILYI